MHALFAGRICFISLFLEEFETHFETIESNAVPVHILDGLARTLPHEKRWTNQSGSRCQQSRKCKAVKKSRTVPLAAPVFSSEVDDSLDPPTSACHSVTHCASTVVGCDLVRGLILGAAGMYAGTYASWIPRV